MIDFTPLSYGDYVLPDWAQALGWMMAVVSVVMIPVFGVVEIWKSYYTQEYNELSFLRVIFSINIDRMTILVFTFAF